MSADVQMLDTVHRILLRDIAAARREVEAYPDDTALWALAPGITNAGGTLALHIAGNLRHFIGSVLGRSGYVRYREAEFAQRGLSREEVAAQLADAERAVAAALSKLDAAQLHEEYPLPIGELRVLVGPYLMHLAVHLAYHLGQLDYHRRIVTGSPATVETIALAPVFAPTGTADV